MLKRPRQSRFTRCAVALFAFVAVGYFSDAVSVPACEGDTGRWLKYPLTDHHWLATRATSKPASYSYPWIVAVDYKYKIGSVAGGSGTRYYLGLLGIPIPIRNQFREEF